MKTYSKDDFPRFSALPYGEIERHVRHARELRSEAAHTMLRHFGQALGHGVGRFFNGLRHRETTHWPAPLRHGRT